MASEEQPFNNKPDIIKINEIDETVKKKTWKEKWQRIRENTTVETVLACYVIPGNLARLATQNLNLDKACRVNLDFGDTVCDALIAREGSKYLKEELAVQELISAMERWKSLLLTAIPCFLIIFLGAWSDRTGKRKLCILLPIFGDLLMCMSNILNAYFFYELPVEVTMFFEAFFPAITGGWITNYMGVFSYISDASSEESRTFRVGIANLCLTVGGPVGTVLSGVLLNSIGYYGVFAVSSALYLISIVYGIIYIEDSKRKDQKNNSRRTNVLGFLRSFFDMKHLKDTFGVVFKTGPNNRRIKSILILVSIPFVFGPWCGEHTVKYLFTRYRFNWDALKYSFYSTFYTCVHSLGGIISISLFSHRLQWDDSVLGIISSVSKIIGVMGIAFARSSTVMYMAVVVETFNGVAFTAQRSMSSKLCTREELGKMISVFNLMEVVTAMVFSPIYSWIYMLTLHYDAGIVFYVSIMLTIPAVTIFGWFFKQHKKNVRSQDGNENELGEGNEPQRQTHRDDLINSDVVQDKLLEIKL